MSAAGGAQRERGSARGRTSGDADAPTRRERRGDDRAGGDALVLVHKESRPRGRTWICSARFCRSRCRTSIASTESPTRRVEMRVSVPTTSVGDFAGLGRSPRGSRRARGVRGTCATDARAGATRACDAAVAVPRASTPRGGLKTQAPRNRSRRENGAETAVRQRSPLPATPLTVSENRRVSETSRPRLPGTSRGARALENPLKRASAVD